MKKTLRIISLSIPVLILTGLLVFASYYDLQISQNFADITFGKYYSDNIFGQFFEIFGECPVYFLPAFGFSVFATFFFKRLKSNTLYYSNHFLFFTIKKVNENFQSNNIKINSQKNNNDNDTNEKNNLTLIKNKKACKNDKKIKINYIFNVIFIIFLLIISFALLYYGIYKIFNYTKKMYLFNYNFAFYLFEGFIALILLTIILCNLLNTNDKTLKALCFFSLVAITSIILTNAIVQFAKPIFSRLRYRAMMILNDTTFSGFTNWYQINSNNTLQSLESALNLSNDIFKSFPSGHTAAATSVLSLTSLIFFLPKPKQNTKLFLLIFPILYVIIVAFSRIVMGAHFLSDVVVAIIVGYLCTILFSVVFLKSFYSHKNMK